ncbi:MAG: glutathionylspermidine synthase family protein [Pseudomonadota bacterium]
MKRLSVPARENWQSLVEGRGFDFHTPVNADTALAEKYWEEHAAYCLSEEDVNALYDAAESLNDLCYEAVGRVLADVALMDRFRIPVTWRETIIKSWESGEKNLYGRMDFTRHDGHFKLMEFNADTPTTLYEAAVAQWDRLEALEATGALSKADQFNSLHEDLIKAFSDPRRDLFDKRVYFSCAKDTPEDLGTTEYLQDLAEQAGLMTGFVFVEDIGLSECGRYLTDLDDRVIDVLFKLYPWEMIAEDAFGDAIPNIECTFIEPLWKMVLSNKALLPLLWDMAPEHPNLLPAFFDDDPAAATLFSYVRKPIFGREGANVSIVTPDQRLDQTGPYGAEGFVRQAYAPLPSFSSEDGAPVHTMVGVWLIGGVNDDPEEPERRGSDKPSGLTIREDDGPVTTDDARFVPHYFLPDQ